MPQRAGQRSTRGLELGLELDVLRRRANPPQRRLRPRRRRGTTRRPSPWSTGRRRPLPTRRCPSRRPRGTRPARAASSTGGTSAGPTAARRAGSRRRRRAAALLLLHPKRRHAPSHPPGASASRRPRAPSLCASAAGRVAPAGAGRTARSTPIPSPRSRSARAASGGGTRLRPPPDHGPDGRRVAARPRRVEHARRNGEPAVAWTGSSEGSIGRASSFASDTSARRARKARQRNVNERRNQPI